MTRALLARKYTLTREDHCQRSCLKSPSAATLVEKTYIHPHSRLIARARLPFWKTDSSTDWCEQTEGPATAWCLSLDTSLSTLAIPLILHRPDSQDPPIYANEKRLKTQRVTSFLILECL